MSWTLRHSRWCTGCPSGAILARFEVVKGGQQGCLDAGPAVRDASHFWYSPWHPPLFSQLVCAFGLISAVIQFIGQLFPGAFVAPSPIAVASVVLCVVWGLYRSYPRQRISHEFRHPHTAVTVKVGDLFDQEAHLVVNFADTFDTAIENVINRHSVQAQLLERVYDGDVQQLDKQIVSALSDVHPVAREIRRDKRRGKLTRYAVGTVAVLGEHKRRIFAVAGSHMSNDLVAKSSVQDWWFSLSRLWDAVYRYGEYGRVAIPVVGSGLSRLDFLDRQTLIKMIIQSFVARSREAVVCRELTVVIWPADVVSIDMLEIAAFLRAL